MQTVKEEEIEEEKFHINREQDLFARKCYFLYVCVAAAAECHSTRVAVQKEVRASKQVEVGMWIWNPFSVIVVVVVSLSSRLPSSAAVRLRCENATSLDYPDGKGGGFSSSLSLFTKAWPRVTKTTGSRICRRCFMHTHSSK